MARRKRASMREGPLADLFRSTIREESQAEPPTEQGSTPPPSQEETRVIEPERPSSPEPPREPPAPPVPREPETTPPDPERLRAYRLDDPMSSLPEPKDRLSRIFAEEHDVEGPAYGREEPGMGEYHGPPRPRLPVIRVVGVGGAGVNAINRMIEAQS